MDRHKRLLTNDGHEFAMTIRNPSARYEIRTRVIMHTSEPSGLGHYVSKVVVALAKIGVPVVMFCPANSEDETQVRAAGVEIVHAAKRDTSHAGFVSRILRNLRFLAKTALVQFQLVRHRDIVHFQGMLHLPLGFVFYLLVKLRGGFIVLTAHDPVPHKWRFPRGLRWLERGMLRLAYLLSDRIIVHNETGKAVLVREFHLSRDRIDVVPHGPYLEPAIDAVTYPDFECVRLLAFGSIRENKGLHLAIHAVQMVAARSGHPVHLTIAGRVDPAERRYWEQCKQIMAAHSDNFEVIDRHILDDEVGPLLARHHALLLPYTQFFSESGVATLALSHRRPILSTTSGGLGELVARGAGVIPIVLPTADSLFEAIMAATQLGPEKLERMGIEGCEFIQKTRSWESIAHKTAKAYSQLGVSNLRSAPNLHGELTVKAVEVDMATDQTPPSVAP